MQVLLRASARHKCSVQVALRAQVLYASCGAAKVHFSSYLRAALLSNLEVAGAKQDSSPGLLASKITHAHRERNFQACVPTRKSSILLAFHAIDRANSLRRSRVNSRDRKSKSSVFFTHRPRQSSQRVARESQKPNKVPSLHTSTTPCNPRRGSRTNRRNRKTKPQCFSHRPRQFVDHARKSQAEVSCMHS